MRDFLQFLTWLKIPLYLKILMVLMVPVAIGCLYIWFMVLRAAFTSSGYAS